MLFFSIVIPLLLLLAGLLRGRTVDDLDAVLGHWSPADPITGRMLTQNILVVGRSGSGKTSGPGDYLFRCLVRHRNSGGLFLASKKIEDLAYVRRVFREEGRPDDLIILEPGGPHRFGIPSYEMQERKSGTQDLTQLFLLLGETLDRMESGGGQGGDGFFKAKNREGLDHAIEIVTRATGELDPYALQCFITGAAQSAAELQDEEWQNAFHNQALLRAAANCTTERQRHDCKVATRHWKETWVRMNDRTRTSIEAGLLSPLHIFNTGIVRELLATPDSTVTPADMEEGKWVMVNMPVTPGDATAVFVNAAVKLAFQRYILSRTPRKGAPLLCIWSDEFQAIANSFDRAYVEACRSRRAALVALTQSAHALYARLHGQGGDHETDALLTNFFHIVCCTLGDAKTAKNFAGILGMRRELFISPSLQPEGGDLYESVVWGRSRLSASANESYQPVLQPAAFLSGLRCGGPPDNAVDAIVIRSGLPFNQSGENYLFTSFKQR